VGELCALFVVLPAACALSACPTALVFLCGSGCCLQQLVRLVRRSRMMCRGNVFTSAACYRLILWESYCCGRLLSEPRVCAALMLNLCPRHSCGATAPLSLRRNWLPQSNVHPANDNHGIGTFLFAVAKDHDEFELHLFADAVGILS
jgi:hypothetical protein